MSSDVNSETSQTEALLAARSRPEFGSWWDYIDSRNRTSQDGEASTQGAMPISSSAFVMHAMSLLHAPMLDVDVVSHCNLNCASCCHFAPIASSAFLLPEDFERDLRKLARVEGIATYLRGINLMGGEPLLHPRLPELVRATRRCLPEVQLSVTTNGLLVKAMGPEFWNAMRSTDCRLVFSRYPTGQDYEPLMEFAQARGVSVGTSGGSAEGGVISHFLRTPLDEEGRQDRTASFNRCPLGGYCMQLLDGKIFPCNRGALLSIVNERFGTAFAHEKDDYLELDAIRSVEDIDAMRRRSHPMCRYCATQLDERIAWRRSAAERDEWLMRPDERQLVTQTGK